MNQNHLIRVIRLLMTACLLVVLSACNSSNGNHSETTVTKLPSSIQKLTLPSGVITAWITVDGGTRTQMTIENVEGTASTTITGLTRATHSVLIEFEFTDSNQTIFLATATRSIDLSAGSASLSFVDADYDTSYDEDQDGLSNVDELASGKNPFGQPAFSTSCFPHSIFDANGDMVFNYDGDLLIADSSDSLFLMDHTSCDLTTLSTVSGEVFVAVVEDKVRNRVYAGSFSNSIYEINPDDGSSSLLVNLGATIFNMVMAPPGYGSYGGQLIVSDFDGGNGRIVAIDQSVGSPTPNVIATVTGIVGNLAFGNDGTLYASDTNGSKIVTVAADGTLTDFASGPGLTTPVGLEVDNSGSRLFIGELNSGALYSASIPSGSLTIINPVNFDDLQGIAYDNHDTLLMITGTSQIEARSTAPFNTSCLPLTVTGADFSVSSYADYGVGDLLLTTYTADDIRLLNRGDCTLTTLSNDVSSGNLLGLTYDRSLNEIYTGSTDNNIYTVDPVDGSSTLLTAVAAQPNGLVVAPSGYGAFGGQLIVALSNGEIYAIDQTQAAPVPALITTLGGPASDLVFGSDGTLYVADYNANNILTLTSGGVTAIFAGGLSGPDGLAIDYNGSRLFVASSGDDTLRQVTIPAGVVSDLSAVDFNIGFFPSGIFFDQYSTVLMGVGQPHTITAFGL